MSREESKTVSVPNISCGHCVNTIQREVAEVPGVRDVRADQAARQVTVSWDPETSDWVVIEEKMKEIAYPSAGEV